ncbi:MAG: methyl-accepting chemotaxis protein [Proteobacteria bacterium]|nr:methyl-accepting chemotaxis protein [Pseudomonadota bacterium]
MRISLQTRILLLMGFIGVFCTSSAILVSTKMIEDVMQKDLIEKSKAILSRVEQGAHYVATMNTLPGIIQDTIQMYPDGVFSEEHKLKILRSVPIYAAFKIGEEGAEKEHYRFRIASLNPRNKDNLATKEEADAIGKFNLDTSLAQQVIVDKEKNSLSVIVPVRISEKRNCLSCHGHPSTSPYKNGKDILGYPMEDLKEGDLRATFAVVSSLKPMNDEYSQVVMLLLTTGSVGTALLLLLGYIGLRKPFGQLNRFSNVIESSSEELKSASDELGSASQQLASSSQQQASSIEETSSNLEEISGTVASSLKGAQSSLEFSRKVSDLIKQGNVSMSELSDSVHQIAEANQRVEKLAKVIEEIGEKTELIDEIVFQTRLLSFNASVEAERAGEHGRGFAVVAQEVGNLAQMSGKSAGEIGQIVKASIKEAQEVAQINRVKVERGVALCKITENSLVAMEESSRKIVEISEQIVRSSEEQNAGIQQINTAIQLISQATQENSSASQSVSEGGQSVVLHSEKLSQISVGLSALLSGSTAQHAVDHSTESGGSSKNNNGKTRKISKGGVPSNKAFTDSHNEKQHHSASPSKRQEDPWDKL